MGGQAQAFYRERVTTGVAGLDEVLRGGLPSGRLYVLRGGPGTGKTTMGLQFLIEGSGRGEAVLFLSLLQTTEEIRDITDSHGWSIDDIGFVELPEHAEEMGNSDQTVFDASEVELGEVADAIIEQIQRVKPRRFVIDSLNELSTIVENNYQLRRQLVRIKRAILALEESCTALLVVGRSLIDENPTAQTIVHGSILLKREPSPFGAPHRRLEVEKVRGIDFDGGEHDYLIQPGGVTVTPRLNGDGGDGVLGETISSGNDAIEAMFGGGLRAGSTCLVMGTSGAGKSTLASLYAASVADAGQHVCVFNFDETRQTYLARLRGLRMGVAEHVDAGRIDLQSYHTGQLVAGEMTGAIKRAVGEHDAKLVVIDSYTGFDSIMGQPALTTRLNELFAYLSSRGVLTLVTFNLHGLFGNLAHHIDASYLADTVVLMRHFEAAGQVRQCVSVLKKRHGDHERTVRELKFVPGKGIELGPPLEHFSGVLTGQPQYHGRMEELFGQESDG